MGQITPTQTRCTPLQFAEAAARVWTDGPLTNRVLWLLMAHSDLETAGWSRMWCYNAGNIIRTPQWTGDWYAANDAGNPRQFRAYPTLDSGVSGLVSLLTGPSRPQWRAGLLSGDPATYVAALAGQHGGPRYFEADPTKYLPAFEGRYQQYAGIDYLGASPSLPDATTPVSSDTPMWYVCGIAALGAALTIWRNRK